MSKKMTDIAFTIPLKEILME